MKSRMVFVTVSGQWGTTFLWAPHDGVDVSGALEELEWPCIQDAYEDEVLFMDLDWEDWRTRMGEASKVPREQMEHLGWMIQQVLNGELKFVSLTFPNGVTAAVSVLRNLDLDAEFVEAVKARNEGRFLDVEYNVIKNEEA